MSLLIGMVIGVLIFFFLKEFTFFAPIIAGFVAGLIAKGPVKGLAAGILTVLIGTLLLSVSTLTAASIINNLGIFSKITGLSVSEIKSLDFKGLFIALFSITGIISAAIAGAIGGFIHK